MRACRSIGITGKARYLRGSSNQKDRNAGSLNQKDRNAGSTNQKNSNAGAQTGYRCCGMTLFRTKVVAVVLFLRVFSRSTL